MVQLSTQKHDKVALTRNLRRQLVAHHKRPLSQKKLFSKYFQAITCFQNTNYLDIEVIFLLISFQRVQQ